MRDVILVTGGAGFVGSSIALLLKKDYPKSRVMVLDNLKRRGSELNVPRLKAASVDFFHGDIRSAEDIEQVGGFDLLIDCAAEPSVNAGYDSSPAYVIRTNLDGTINCLESARKYKADMLFLSTSRVYPIHKLSKIKYKEDNSRLIITDDTGGAGISGEGISERFSLEGSRSMYGATKLASELLLTEYNEMYGMRTIVNRCGVLTGPWQMGKVDQGFVVLWVARHLFGGNLSYIGFGGEGKQVRDILHVDDLYRLLKIQYAQIDKFSGQTFNVGGGLNNSVSLCEMTRLCEEVTGKKIAINCVKETRKADIPIYISDCTKVTEATGWKPEIFPKQIVEEITEWLQVNERLLRPILE
jgi:CDP-paratose 2-epimerase